MGKVDTSAQVIIEVAQRAGVCPGVSLALRKTREILQEAGGGSHVVATHEIVHNNPVMKELREAGLIIEPDPLRLAKGDALLVSAHGMSKRSIARMAEAGRTVHDLTCGIVKDLQRAAINLEQEGCHVFVYGNPAHPEVVGTVANLTEGNSTVIPSWQEAEAVKLHSKNGLVTQTTKHHREFSQVCEILTQRCHREDLVLKVVDTTCRFVVANVERARELAGRSDLMIVVGSPQSSNASALTRLIGEITPTYMVEDEAGLARMAAQGRFQGVARVGITGGTSTPREHILRLAERLREMLDTDRRGG